MTDSTITTIAANVFEYGGRKRKGDKPAFTKFSRTIDFTTLPAESQAFLIRYGITQYTVDGMNTADSDSEAQAAVDARIAKLVAADFSRESGGGFVTNDPEVLANTIAREELSAIIAAQKVTLTKEQRSAATTAYRTANAERLVKAAVARIEARTKEAGAFDLAAFLTPAA